MKKLLTVVFGLFSVFYFSITFAAEKTVNTVVITFADRTPYSALNTNQIIEQSMIEHLLYLSQFSLMEHFALPETLTAEKSLNKPLGSVSKVVETGDFQAALDATRNGIGSKGKGAVVSPVKTRMIGKKYHAEYLIHGTIDYLGRDHRELMLPLLSSLFKLDNPYLEALVTVRIIHADTGIIVWCKQEKGVSKDSLVKYKGVSLGTGEYNNKMFVEAMEKISLKIVKAIKQDIEDKKLTL